MHKRATRTEFACFVKHVTPSAIKLSVPLGRMESMPTIDPLDYETLIARNRERYALPSSEIKDADTVRPEPVVIDIPPDETATEKPEPTAPSEPSPVTPTRTLPIQQGRGGAQHKDMQQAIRTVGHRLGYLADIEDEVFDSENRARQIDVALRKDGILIACEISITTKPEHEVENIARCFDAGVHHVFVIAPDPKHRLNIETLAKAELPNEQFNYVSVVLSSEEVAIHLAEIETHPHQEETVMRGYKVVTTFDQPDEEERQRRREAFARAVLRDDAPENLGE